MYEAKIGNVNGEVLLLTGNEPVYQVINITGLNPPKAQINTTTMVGLDGAKFNSSKLETRNIVLTVKINGDVEANRLKLYQYFRTKEWCKFYYSNDSVNVFIVGYVESVECNLFTNNETAQISILCPYPYFKSLTEIVTDISNTLGLFVFPFSINLGEPIAFSSYDENKVSNVYNASESETGVVIQITFLASASSIEIKNTLTGDDLTLNYSFQENDVVTINTYKGQKSISLLRAGMTSNIFSALEQGSTFFQLAMGSNLFGYLVDGGSGNESVLVTFTHNTEYRGV